MKREALIFCWLLGLSAALIMSPALGLGHGPKGHTADGLTALAAAQKGVLLFDKLIASGKLDESWETRFAAAEVTRHEVEGRTEFVVKFTRDQGNPAAVFIFLDEKGKYRGSNFSGK